MNTEITQEEINTLRAIKAGALSRKSDEEIGKEVGLTGFKVSSLRQFLGLRKRGSGSIFSEWRKLCVDNNNDHFFIGRFCIPNDLAKEVIGIKMDRDYKITAHAEKGAIRIDIVQV